MKKTFAIVLIVAVLATALTSSVSGGGMPPALCIEKTVDCNDDGIFLDEDTGIAGDTAHWKVVVTNCGNSPVTNIVVTDTNLHDFGTPFDLPNNGDFMEFNYDSVVDVDTTNTATAAGDDGIGGTVGPVSDSATNLVITPAISIVKTVDCNDDGTFLNEDTGIAGDTAHWKVVVTNCGNSPVTNIVVTDTNLHDFGTPFDLPNNGDFMEFNYDSVVDVDTTNTATAQGKDKLGGTVGPVSDSATNYIIHPDISIDKTVDCDGDGDFADEETTVGPDTPTWRIVVCNTGDSVVYNIHVTDTNGEDYTIASLDPGVCDTYEYVGTEIDATTTNTATAQGKDKLGGTVGPVSDSATNYIITSPGTGTPGYWKNHPDAWPVDDITIGGVTYTKDDAIGIMNTPEKGDKTYTMFRALVAAKLNVLIGSDGSCIIKTINDADAWMAKNPVGSGVKAGGKDSPWRDGEPLYEKLDDYNNGLLCAPPRE